MPNVPAWFAWTMAAIGAAVLALFAYADRLGARRQHAEDTALLARTDELPTVGRDTPCPRCHGRRCEPWRTRGADCGPQTAPKFGYTLWSSLGKHAPVAAFARAVPRSWSPLPLQTRVRLAPTFWAPLVRPAQNGVRTWSRR